MSGKSESVEGNQSGVEPGDTSPYDPGGQEAGTSSVDSVDIEGRTDTDGIIKNHVIAAMGLGLVPVPVVDVVAIVGVQLNMVRQLARAYDVPFRDNVVRGGILSLIGGILPVGLGVTASSFLKMIPGLGTITGSAGVVILAGALTYAVGAVFERHLASGGTFLDFDASKVRSLFRRKFEEGKSVAEGLKGGAKSGTQSADGDSTRTAA